MRKPVIRVFIVWFLLFLFWSCYRFFFRFPEWFDEYLVKPLFWIGLVLFVVFSIEKRSLASIGLSGERLFRNIYIGLGIGTIFAIEGLVVNFIKYGRWSFIPSSSTYESFIFLLITSFVTGFVEELFSRGYLMSRLMEFLKSEVFANLISSILFVFIHIPIAVFVLHYSFLDLIIYLWTIFLLGLANGYIFARTKTIVAPTVSHALWNLSIVLFR
jgi:uncharacterized protein